MTKRELWTLVAIVLGAVAIFGVFMVTYPFPGPEAPDEVVILPAATPADEIVALGYESHFTGMFVELFMGAEVQTTIVVTEGMVLPVTGTYQPLTSAGDVTCTIDTDYAPGRYTGVRDVTYTTGSLLWLTNITDTTITVEEGDTADLTGTSVALGISDTLLLFFDSSDWIELSESNN